MGHPVLPGQSGACFDFVLFFVYRLGMSENLTSDEAADASFYIADI
jgi:hypothetical protein